MALQVHAVTKRFGQVLAVDRVSFAAAPGRVCGLLGSNGAGKTTTMRMIMRLILPDRGRITWQGHPVTDETRTQFGYLPEERGLYPKMPVREQLVYLTELKGLSRAEAARRVDRWLDQLDLGAYARRPLEQLSKGNQQRIQFIAAVASGPSLCILDEPFSGLDPVGTAVMENALRTVAGAGTMLLLSAHNLEQVEALCDDVVLLHRARVVLSGALDAIKQQARRPTVHLRMAEGDYSFLGELPGLQVREAKAGAREIALPLDLEPNRLLHLAAARGTVLTYSVGEPSLREIYLERVGGTHA